MRRRRPTHRGPKRTDALGQLLASGALARLVLHWLVRPTARLHVRELLRLTGLSPRSLTNELARLETLGVIRREAAAPFVYYVVQAEHPQWLALRNFVRALATPADLLRAALVDAPDIQAAFIFGSTARGDARPDSDIDLCVIGSPGEDHALARAAVEVGALLGRDVNAIDFTSDEWARLAASGDRFVTRVLAEAKEWVLGSASALPTAPPSAGGR